MHGVDPKDGDRDGNRDGGRKIDWSQTSADYAKHRPGYPKSFYQRLLHYDIGLKDQSILDLATGTGTIARAFASAGAKVVGVDIADGQIESAKQLAKEQNLEIDFKVAPAEQTNLPDNSFDVISASQSWLYFDKSKLIPEIKRLLKPGGKLLTCHLCWLPRVDQTAKETEALILKANPDWSGGDWSGEIPFLPQWTENSGEVKLGGHFYYDEDIPFTHASWRGRIRASRGISASLSPEEVSAFDLAHKQLLNDLSLPENFTILHRIDAHIFTLT